jgi:hypothetical protein
VYRGEHAVAAAPSCSFTHDNDMRECTAIIMYDIRYAYVDAITDRYGISLCLRKSPTGRCCTCNIFMYSAHTDECTSCIDFAETAENAIYIE